MSSWTIEPPRSDEAAGIAELLAASEIAEHGVPDSNETDVRSIWAWPRFDRERDAWVARTPQGQIVGYAWVWGPRGAEREFSASLVTGPGLPTAALGGDLLRRVEQRARELAGDALEPAELFLSCASSNEPKRDLLMSRGFTSVHTFFRMERELTGEIASPAWPADAVVSEIRRPDDDRALYETFQDSFAEHYRFIPEPQEEWTKRNLDRDDFAPELSLLVRYEGNPVAAVINYVIGDLCWIGSVGVRKPWRRRGLASAMVLRSFVDIQRRGLRLAALGVDSENRDGAVAVYERLGMQVTQRHEVFQRPLVENAAGVSAAEAPEHA